MKGASQFPGYFPRLVQVYYNIHFPINKNEITISTAQDIQYDSRRHLFQYRIL